MIPPLVPLAGRTHKLDDLIVNSHRIAVWTEEELDELCAVLTASDAELAYAVRQFFDERLVAHITQQNVMAVIMRGLLAGHDPDAPERDAGCGIAGRKRERHERG